MPSGDVGVDDVPVRISGGLLMAAPAAVLSILVRANTGQATTALARFNTQLEGSQRKASKSTAALKTFGKVGAIGAAVSMGLAVKKAADFESQMSSLGAVTNASGHEMKQFKKQALDAGAATKFSALDAAKAQTELAKGGLSVSQIMKGGLKSSLALAAAGELELADAAETTANAIKLFGLRGKDTMKVADQFATAANKTTADVTDFAMALKQGGGVAKMAGLSFTETMLALEALAETGVRNSDAGTSMKTAFIQLLKPSEKQAELAKQLGLNFVSASGGMKNMSQISEMLRSKLGGMTKAQRTAALATLAGTDGVRTLNALYAAGPNKLDKMRAGLDKTGTAAQTAAKKQDNLKGKLENLQGSIETLAIVVGSALLPALTSATAAVTKFINGLTSGKGAGGQMTAMLNSLRLSVGLSKADWEAFGRAMQNVWTAVHAVMARVLPAIVQMLRGWVMVVGGLLKIITGILTLDFRRAWDGVKQIFSGGLQAILGNVRMVTAPFRTAVAALASAIKGPFGVAWNAVKAVASGALRALLNLLKAFTSPHRAAAKVLGSAVSGPISSAFRAVRGVAGSVMRAVLGALRSMTGPWKVAGAALGNAIRGPVVTAVRAMRDVVGKVLAALRGVFSTNARRVMAIMAGLGGGIAAVGTAIAAVFNALARVVGAVIRFITKAINRLVGAIGKAKDKLGDVVPSLPSFPSIPNVPGLPGIQRGAYVAKGKATGDSVPAVLEKGEYVLNRKAVSKVGRKQLDAVNYGTAPRFQKGGAVGMAGGGMVRVPGDPDTTGGRDKVAPGIARQVASWIKRFKIQIGYAFDPGGGHVSPGHNVTGTALDVYPGVGGSWDSVEAGLKAAVRAGKKVLYGTNGVGIPWPNHGRGNHGHVEWGGGGGVGGSAPGGAGGAGQIPPINIKGSGIGADLARGATSKMRGVANAYLERMAGSTSGTAGSHSVPPGMRGQGSAANRAMGKAMAARRGWKGPQWAALDDLWGRLEGSWDENLPNMAGSGAYGIAQALPASKYPPAGRPDAPPGLKKAAAQIGWGLDYIASGNSGAASFRDPVGARAWRLAKGWYQSGGAVEAMQKGGLPAKLKAALPILRKGNLKKRRKALGSVMKDVKGIGLPKSLEDSLKKHSGDAKVFGEYANRAGELTVTPDTGDPIQGKVNGLTEADWLTKQLQALFSWRNAAIKAQEQVVAKRERIAALIEQARKAYYKVRAEMEQAAKRKQQIAKQLTILRKKPKANKAAIQKLHKEGTVIDRAQRGRQRVATALKDKILPGLRDRRSTLNTRRGEILTDLEQIQGSAPMNVMASLPTVGVLGGEIFSAQMRLAELGKKPSITDTSSDGTERADLLSGLLKEANLRTAVSERQFKVLRDMPPFGGSFATGGVVPGPAGVARTVIAHGGEAIGQPGDVQVVINGDIVNTPRGKDPVELLINDRRFDAAVKASNRRDIRGVGRTPGGAR